MQTRQRQKMSQVTVQHALAEWRNQVHVGGPLPRTVITVHVLVFSYVMCCSTAASTVAVGGSNHSVQTTGVHGLRTAPRHTPSLAQHRRRTVSFTRRTHWRNKINTSTTRKLCAQHKCHLQGSSQSTTALVADLVTFEVKVLQRRICLVKIARTCHGAAWSTILTHVDRHVSPRTPDAKLIELLNSMPCPTCRGHRRFKKESRVVFSVTSQFMSYSSVTSLHELSCCVDHWHVECIHTISIHDQKACFAKLRRDIESIQPSLTQWHRAPHHTCVPPMQSTLVSQRTIGAECSSCRAMSWRNMFFDKGTLFMLSSRGVTHLIEVVGTWVWRVTLLRTWYGLLQTLVKKGHGLNLDTDDPLMMYEVVSVMHRRYLECGFAWSVFHISRHKGRRF